MKSDTEFYIEQKESEQCWCGNEKRAGFAFCYACYLIISRRELFISRPLSLAAHTQEFREAFDEAVKILEEEEA